MKIIATAFLIFKNNRRAEPYVFKNDLIFKNLYNRTTLLILHFCVYFLYTNFKKYTLDMYLKKAYI